MTTDKEGRQLQMTATSVLQHIAEEIMVLVVALEAR